MLVILALDVLSRAGALVLDRPVGLLRTASSEQYWTLGMMTMAECVQARKERPLARQRLASCSRWAEKGTYSCRSKEI